MRGSGRMMPNAFADLFGCGIDDKFEIESDHGPIVFSWPASSAAGASIGSMRQALTDLGAEVGDYMFVAKNEERVSFTRLSAAELESASSKLGRLLKLVGHREISDHSEMVGQLSDALQVSGANDEERVSACRLKLKARGEDDLARLIDEPKLSVEGYLSSMEELFKQ